MWVFKFSPPQPLVLFYPVARSPRSACAVLDLGDVRTRKGANLGDVAAGRSPRQICRRAVCRQVCRKRPVGRSRLLGLSPPAPGASRVPEPSVARLTPCRRTPHGEGRTAILKTHPVPEKTQAKFIPMKHLWKGRGRRGPGRANRARPEMVVSRR